ncbi:MAG: response regulator [Verrucomicrobiales bacterium]|nr:response regulator [Verrucomicrobiales bacterium]MCP5526677.1 response regulator [Verrucomicrobiales bacterium]
MNTNPNTRILVADDELFMLRLLEATFRKGGHEVILSRNGTEALAAAEEASPALIVMDVMMPGLDGLAAIRQLKESPGTRHIPVIVLSSKGQALTEVEAVESGAALFLTKPFSPTYLLEAVRKLLEHSADEVPSEAVSCEAAH